MRLVPVELRCSSPDASLHRYCLSIAGITIEIETELPPAVDPQFQPFLAELEAPDFRVFFRRVEQLPPVPESVLHEDNCYRVHPDGKGGYLRTFFDAPRDLTPYALAVYDYEAGIIRVDYLEKGAHCIAQMHSSFFHLGFESLLVRKKRLCVHAACVSTPLGGLLFSGPSGIGKSTQAELWCRYRGAHQINGDRPILSGTDKGWLAWGSPYAGSSRCHINENCPVAAMIMLRQAKQCSLRRLSQREAFRAVWSGLTLCGWDAKMVEDAFSLAAELIGTIPVYEFSCTPDEAAVEYLERELQTEWNK